jgi:hypothetical protein
MDGALFILKHSIKMLCNLLTLNFLKAPICKSARATDSAVPVNCRIPLTVTDAGYSQLSCD